MKRFLLSLSLLFGFGAMPLAAHAVVPSGELTPICQAASPVCRAYVLGGAERFWLFHSKHESCVADDDLKTLDTLMAGVVGKDTPFAKKPKDMPAAFTLLEMLMSKKMEMCSLGMKTKELLDQCDSKAEKDQNLCHAYIGGVLDMALALNEIGQRKSGAKEVKALFCESMSPPKPKMKMSEKEVLAAIAEWRKARPDRPSKTPAAQEVINALVIKYPCNKDNILKLEKKK